MKKYIIRIIVSIIVVLVFVFYMDLINITYWLYGDVKLSDVMFNFSLAHLDKKVFKEIFVGILGIETTSLAILGTYYFTDKSNKEVIRKQEEIFEEQRKDLEKQIELEKKMFEKQREDQARQLEFEKEIAYRNMNKANAGTILKEVQVLHQNNIYLFNLVKIEKCLKTGDIFDDEYKEVVKKSCEFLKKIKQDFYYDDNIVKKIDSILDVENISEEEDKLNILSEYFFEVKRLYMKFYSLTEEEQQKVLYDEIEIKAIKKLWQKLFLLQNSSNKLVREYIVYFLNSDLDISLGIRKEDEEKIKIIVEYKDVFEKLYRLRNNVGIDISEEYENLERTNELKEKLNTKNKEVLKMELESWIEEYGKIYEYKIGYFKLIDFLGSGNEALLKHFVEEFSKKYEEGIKVNYTEEFIIEHKYI